MIVVKVQIRESDELFVMAAIMPCKSFSRKDGTANIQDGLKVIDIPRVLIVVFNIQR